MLGNQTDHRGSVYQIDPVGPANVSGAEVFQYASHLGRMNVMLDPHLDGTPVKILAIPTNNVLYRPLEGNGNNRDTTVYPGVMRIQNSGVDAVVNLVQTEFGIQCTLPERWAIWL